MLISGQLQIIGILVGIFIVDSMRGVILEDYLTNYLIVFFIFLHMVVHNRGLGSMCIIYCADILENLSWMIVGIKVCSFTVVLTSEFMI